MNRLSMLDLGGTVRTRPPEETIRLVKPLLKQFGITRVANVTGLDCVNVPVWCAIRPLARSLTVSQGKGVSHELAAISATLESIELHHAERVSPGMRFSVGKAIVDNCFLNPLQLPIRSDVIFREKMEIQWILGRNESSKKEILVPREIISRDSRLSTWSKGLFFSSSNGLASGNCRDEAIIHGLAEVIERDQMAFWQMKKEFGIECGNTRLNLSTIDDPQILAMLENISIAGLEVCVWYTTTNIRVPTFTCTVWDSRYKTPYPHKSSGHGCHPYKKIALFRAITEALQSRLTFISGGRDDIYWSAYNKFLPANLRENKNIIKLILCEVAHVSFQLIPEAPKIESEKDLLLWLVNVVENDAEVECVVVDLSEKSLPINVVHVICPGLEICARRNLYSPGQRMVNFLKKFNLI